MTDVKEEKKEKEVDFIGRGSLAIVAGGTAIALAAIGSLPGADCAPMAETYARAIGDFGAAGLLAGTAFTFGKPLHLSREFIHYVGRARLVIYFHAFRLAIFFCACLVFFMSVCVSAWNVERATYFCRVGHPEQLKLQSHMHIDLAGLRNFWRVFTPTDAKPSNP